MFYLIYYTYVWYAFYRTWCQEDVPKNPFRILDRLYFPRTPALGIVVMSVSDTRAESMHSGYTYRISGAEHKHEYIDRRIDRRLSWFARSMQSTAIRYCNDTLNADNCHDDVIKWRHFCVTGTLCGEFTDHRWIPLTKASDAELWCFLSSAPITVE